EKNIDPDNLKKREPKRRGDRVHALELGHGSRGVKLRTFTFASSQNIAVSDGMLLSRFRSVTSFARRAGRPTTELRFFHLATVFWLMP
ncbi:MAG: hypothetical protein L0Y60_14475, partial [Beijerinckiaceae bacterium]|nr:hypothetical protein [Beijerinckiaceae bacterium]